MRAPLLRFAKPNACTIPPFIAFSLVCSGLQVRASYLDFLFCMCPCRATEDRLKANSVHVGCRCGSCYRWKLCKETHHLFSLWSHESSLTGKVSGGQKVCFDRMFVVCLQLWFQWGRAAQIGQTQLSSSIIDTHLSLKLQDSQGHRLLLLFLNFLVRPTYQMYWNS